MEELLVGDIRWQGRGGYAWTVEAPLRQAGTYRTDTYCRGLWRDGVQVLGVEVFHLELTSRRTRRDKVLRTLEGL